MEGLFIGRAPILLVAALATLLLASCAGSEAADTGTPVGGSEPVRLRLGYLPNVTHAPALLGLGGGIFADALADGVRIEATALNAGPTAVESLFAGALDAAFIGPNLAVNAFAKSNGEAIRILSGTTSGGAFLVVRPDIASPADLERKKLATPQLGGTQDVALRDWLAGNGLETTVRGGGDVSILPQENAQTLDAFVQGSIGGGPVGVFHPGGGDHEPPALPGDRGRVHLGGEPRACEAPS